MSNVRKCSAARGLAVAARHRCADLLARSRATRSTSIVVWFATPTRSRSRSKSKPGEHRLAERSRERRRGRRPALDVVADQPRLVHVEHDEIAPAGILHHLARGGPGLLVVVLAVDERREAVARVPLDPLPHVEHRAARRVHQDAADRRAAARSRRIVTPNAGRITTSSGVDRREIELAVRVRDAGSAIPISRELRG